MGLLSLIAMAGPILVRRRWTLKRLETNNEVAGFKFAVVGVLYAVLLAFAVIVVWEKFTEADDRVAAEAGAAATIYRLADGMGGDPGAGLRAAITAYLQAAVADDWAAMDHGAASPAATRALDAVYATLSAFEPVDQHGEVVMAEVLYQLDQLTQARRARIVLASGIVPGVVWLVLFFGAVVTIGFTLFFGTENVRAQALMTGALASLIFSGLLIIIAIDRPFSGTVTVGPEALVAVLEDFGGVAEAASSIRGAGANENGGREAPRSVSARGGLITSCRPCRPCRRACRRRPGPSAPACRRSSPRW